MNQPGNPAQVAVVIVNWQRPQDTIHCVRSVMDSDYSDIHIIVVDNGSDDGSADKIKEAFPGINLISLPDNLGFTGGYNQGIVHAMKESAPYIFLINNDTVIEIGTIRLLVNSSWDVAVPKITYFDDQNLIWAAGARWRNFPPAIKMIGYQKPDGNKFNNPVPLDYTTGCALMIKKKVLAVVNGFDPQYVNYMEDYDFSYRVRDSGFSMGYVPEARVLHKVSQSLGLSSPQRWYYMGRNTVLFYHKDNRFPNYVLWGALGWILIREFLLGNTSHLPSFWKGMKEGLNLTAGKRN
jgi:GT2 family glycosyltransferase